LLTKKLTTVSPFSVMLDFGEIANRGKGNVHGDR